MTPTMDREETGALPNPLGIAGIEFVEYATARPQAFGQVLQMLGFVPVARHRSREVTLYRQGGMNVIVNAHGPAANVPDAGAADRRALEHVPAPSTGWRGGLPRSWNSRMLLPSRTPPWACGRSF